MSSEERNLVVDQRWQKEFDTFVETGEASDEFFVYLDQDRGCQEAVDRAFNAQASAFEEFSQAIKAATLPSCDETRARSHVVVGFFRGFMRKWGSERRNSTQDSGAHVAQVATERDGAELKSTVESLERTV